MEEDKLKGDLILGLDISTACIGVSEVYDDGENTPQVIKMTHIIPKIPNKIKGIEALILRKEIFEKEFLTSIADMGITECVIESPMIFATGNSNAQTVAQLLQFNALISEAVYRILHIVPHYISSADARMYSFPELLSIRKFNKKGNQYPLDHVRKNLMDNHLVLFGDYPFDCDKKFIMLNCVSDKYPDIKWTTNAKGEFIKQNYDACDSLVCVLGYINQKRYGEMKPIVECLNIHTENNLASVHYVTKVWHMKFDKKMELKVD